MLIQLSYILLHLCHTALLPPLQLCYRLFQLLYLVLVVSFLLLELCLVLFNLLLQILRRLHQNQILLLILSELLIQRVHISEWRLQIIILLLNQLLYLRWNLLFAPATRSTLHRLLSYLCMSLNHIPLYLRAQRTLSCFLQYNTQLCLFPELSFLLASLHFFLIILRRHLRQELSILIRLSQYFKILRDPALLRVHQI